jgi:hypothetical protein
VECLLSIFKKNINCLIFPIMDLVVLDIFWPKRFLPENLDVHARDNHT